jgi:hypothetical protein
LAKTKSGNTPSKASAPRPPTGNNPQVPLASKGTNIASSSTLAPTDQKANNKLKGTMGVEDKEVPFDPSNPDNKLQISSNLDPK